MRRRFVLARADAAPDRFEKLFLRYHAAGALEQREQRLRDLRCERHRDAAITENQVVGAHAIRTKGILHRAIACAVHGIRAVLRHP